MSSQPPTVWFITGTSRGIGLEVTKQLLQSPTNIVLATCCTPSKADALQTLAAPSGGRLHVLHLDVTNIQSVKDVAREAAQIVGNKGIDYLANNAGANAGGVDTAFTLELSNLMDAFKTNLVGPAFIAQLLISLVEKSHKKTIVNISSVAESIGTDLGKLSASYSIAKAGLNMLTSKQAKERPDIIAVTICPGHLQTDMARDLAELGGPTPPLHVSIGVGGVLKVLSSLAPADSGSFFNHKGERVQW